MTEKETAEIDYVKDVTDVLRRYAVTHQRDRKPGGEKLRGSSEIWVTGFVFSVIGKKILNAPRV